ncbi:MAG: iron complex outermembrane receptor protein [Candidatus Krumholzibacteriia bacterium]
MKILTFLFAMIWAANAVGQSEEIHEDSGVVITESRYDDDTKLNLTNITFEELKFREPDLDLPQLLQDVPSVFAYSDAGSGLGYSYLKIRGFEQRRIGVLFNGIPLNDPEDHQIWWVNLPDLASSVQDIQVQRGVTNSVGGMTAIGGTVNIISRDLTAEPEGQVSVNFGSYGTQRQMIQYQTGDIGNSGFRSMMRLSKQESDGYRDRSGNDGWAVFWSLQYETAKTLTKANIYTGREVTHHAWDAVPESVLRTNRKANMETYHNAIDDFRQPHYELHNTWYISDNVELTNRLYHIKGEGFYENFKADQKAENYALDSLLGVPADTDVDLVRQKWVRKEHTGWVPHFNWQHGASSLLVGGDWYTFHSNHWGNVMWAEGITPDDIVGGYNYHQYTGDKDQYSFFAKERWNVGSGLILTADLHYQHKEYKFKQDQAGNFQGDLLNAYTVKYDFFNPKGAVNWRTPGGSMKFFGAVGINHREPTDGELFDTFLGGDDLGVEPLFATRREVLNSDGSVNHVEWSDPYVKEERVVDYELGMSWQTADVEMSLGGYWMDFENEIVALGGVNDDGSGIRGNAGETRHKGVEFEISAQVSRQHKFRLAASKSWDNFVQYTYYDFDGIAKDYSGNRIALFPEHLAMADWTAQWWPDFRTRLRARNTGRQQTDNTGIADHSIDPWTTVDVSFWYELGGKRTTAFLHLRNLANAEYETWGYYFGENYYTPAAGRNFVVGLDYSF